MPSTLYLAITNHGFGHATRAASVGAAILSRCPNLRLIVATTAPEWLLRAYLGDGFEYHQRSFDIGVLQSDSFSMDKAATLAKLKLIYANQNDWVRTEAAFLQHEKVDLVLADIPPLAAPMAKAAGVPGWMMSNFGWDFIYRPWGGEFVAMADWIAECFGQCDQLFRLPFHEPMSAFPQVTDVGLTGGTPRFSEAELRSHYAISTPIAQTVLLTFGGLGVAQIPYETLANYPDWQFITFDQQAPDLPNLLKISDRTLRPVDFMVMCDRIVSKPGYGTFSEATRLQKGIITLPREDFAETTVLLAGIQDYTEHLILEAAPFFAGNWAFLNQPLNPPRQSAPLKIDGNETIATAIANYFA